MAQEITIPRLGWSMDEGTFVEWLKSPGEFVSPGEMLFLLEGEKATHEIESFDSGYLCVPKDAPAPGDIVEVGQVIGFLLAEREPAPTSVRKSPVVDDSTASKVVDTQEAVARTPTLSAAPSTVRVVARSDRESAPLDQDVTRRIASPRARRRARELGVDWTQLIGTGRDGRIRESDVLAHSAGQASTAAALSPEPAPIAAGKHAPASKLRLAIAQRMRAGVQQAAPVTLTTKVDATTLIACREQFKRTAKDGLVPSYNDILIYLAARTLRDLPELNACWHRDGIHLYEEVNVATAVDTDAGLVAPVIQNADELKINEIAEQTREAIAQARDGQLSQKQLEGGTFTVSNLGAFGIDAFTPIINLPQAAILGIGRIVMEPVVREGQIQIGQTLTLSLTFDHRVVDGVPAARWLQRLCERIVALGTDVE